MKKNTYWVICQSCAVAIVDNDFTAFECQEEKIRAFCEEVGYIVPMGPIEYKDGHDLYNVDIRTIRGVEPCECCHQPNFVNYLWVFTK